MDKTIDRVFDHLIPEVGGVAVFLHNQPEKVKENQIVKHVAGDGRELTVRNPTHT